MARTKSRAAHKQVLKTAAELFADRGIDATSMDAIAEGSGVSKATIYKHWPDKDALCQEVLVHVHGLDEKQPKFDSGDLRTDLIARLTHEPAADRRDLKEKLWPHLMAYSAKNHAFGVEWRGRVIEPMRRSLAELLKRGQRRGVLQRGIDLEVALALLLGPLMYTHVFMRKQGKPSPKGLEAQVVDGFLARYRKDHSR